MRNSISRRRIIRIDYVIPDYTYLRENEERIVGLSSHGHEDHIGGIHTSKQVKIPKIYASGIAVDLIEYKLGEQRYSNASH